MAGERPRPNPAETEYSRVRDDTLRWLRCYGRNERFVAEFANLVAVHRPAIQRLTEMSLDRHPADWRTLAIMSRSSDMQEMRSFAFALRNIARPWLLDRLPSRDGMTALVFACLHWSEERPFYPGGEPFGVYMPYTRSTPSYSLPLVEGVPYRDRFTVRIEVIEKWKPFTHAPSEFEEHVMQHCREQVRAQLTPLIAACERGGLHFPDTDKTDRDIDWAFRRFIEGENPEAIAEGARPSVAVRTIHNRTSAFARHIGLDVQKRRKRTL